MNIQYSNIYMCVYVCLWMRVVSRRIILLRRFEYVALPIIFSYLWISNKITHTIIDLVIHPFIQSVGHTLELHRCCDSCGWLLCHVWDLHVRLHELLVLRAQLEHGRLQLIQRSLQPLQMASRWGGWGEVEGGGLRWALWWGEDLRASVLRKIIASELSG